MLSMIKYSMITACMAVFLVWLFTPFSAAAFCFEEAGNIYGVSPALLRSIAVVESGLNADAVNRNKNGSEDLGLMQINSEWLQTFQIDRDKLMSDPCYNVMIGARILKTCMDRYGYSWEAVGCYNARTRGKRIDYAWKILREIGREKPPNSKIAEDQKKRIETNNNNTVSSLYFRVRAGDDSDIKGMP